MSEKLNITFTLECGEERPNVVISDQLLSQSFNRFDDKLVEKLLTYLTFSEKVLFESVSKQFKRCVYNQQKKLCLNRWQTEDKDSLNSILEPIVVSDFASSRAVANQLKGINKLWLTSILKKCRSIESIDLECFVNFDDLNIIGKYCPKLRSIVFDIIGLSSDDLDHFGFKYGHRIKLVDFYFQEFVPKYANKLLIHCKNVREFRSLKLTELFCGDNQYLPQLECIPLYYINKEDFNHTSNFERLCEKYSDTMKVIKVTSDWYMNGKQMCLFFSNVCKFKNLFELDLSIRVKNGSEVEIYDYLRRVANNNCKLAKLKLVLNMKFHKHDQIFNVFQVFNNLIELSIDIKNSNHRKKVINGNVECFKSLKCLKSLRISYKQMSEDFFADIDKHLPNLSKLNIICESEITDKTILRLTHLKKLKEFQLNKCRKCNKQITDDSICALLESCPSLKRMYFSSRPNITNKTIEVLISRADRYPKCNLEFVCGLSQYRDEIEFQTIDLISFEHKIPQNLTISISLID